MTIITFRTTRVFNENFYTIERKLQKYRKNQVYASWYYYRFVLLVLYAKKYIFKFGVFG